MYMQSFILAHRQYKVVENNNNELWSIFSSRVICKLFPSEGKPETPLVQCSSRLAMRKVSVQDQLMHQGGEKGEETCDCVSLTTLLLLLAHPCLVELGWLLGENQRHLTADNITFRNNVGTTEFCQCLQRLKPQRIKVPVFSYHIKETLCCRDSLLSHLLLSMFLAAPTQQD